MTKREFLAKMVENCTKRRKVMQMHELPFTLVISLPCYGKKRRKSTRTGWRKKKIMQKQRE